ncbi:sarcosine oxidase subunit delta [Pseudahrensia aquimaris]|uniref:Sarcosine oxidase subunit delta n=1 Tax=Pseudahrensia aquimaris TaxID=744461 RepID=A0ABW3FCM2_9HYPH
MILTCAWCGPRDAREFTYKGDAKIARPAMDNESLEDHLAYVYDRDNPAGLHEEMWQHTGGCRAHVRVVRNTVTHEVISCDPVGPWAEQLKKGATK